MKKMQHVNLVKLHEVIDDDENDKLYMSKWINDDDGSNGLLREGRDTAMGREGAEVPAIYKGARILQ
jgi:hypothetical protein